MSPKPVAGTWSAKISNPDGIFLPENTAGAYYDYFTTGRKVRISTGGNYGGSDVYWVRMIGVMDAPDFSIFPPEVSLKGFDYCQYLTDYKLRSPNNYWGSSVVMSTVGPTETLGAEIYAEADAVEIGAGEADNVTNWAATVAAVSSVADAGGGSTYVMKILFGSGSTVLTFSTAGIFPWICPEGVTSIVVETWGPGGGGGGNRSFYGAGGGGGGGYSKKTITTVPGTTYLVCVGERGYGGDNDPVDDGTPGGDSWFSSPAVVLAKGGAGGERGAGHDEGNGHGGAGGAAASGVGDTKYSGGPGGNGNEDYEGAGGGGGSSAGTAAAGNAGTEGGADNGGAGGPAPAGGSVGGNGGDDDTAGSAPASGNGGGGGGAGWDGTVAEPYGRRGGDGAAGKVTITYTGSVSSDSIINTNVGAVTVDTQYKVTFKYKHVTGQGLLAARAYIGTVRQDGEVVGLTASSYTSITYYFTASDTGDLQLYFDITNGAAGEEFRIDVISVKPVTAIVYTRNYAMPGACTGIYYATLDGSPIYYGEDRNGWFYDAVHNEFQFHPNRAVEAGTNNLVVYYHTAQIPEHVVADILVSVGLYDNRVAALAAMTYTYTGLIVNRVWFDAGTSALQAIQMICERCNYRFYFKYDGTPVFIPEPAIKAAGAEDATFEAHMVASPRVYEDSGELSNVIEVLGDDIAQPLGPEQTKKNNYSGTDSDTTSVTAYGDRTKSISNHLFQSDGVCASMATALLALYKDPRRYLDFVAAINAIPLELGDTLSIKIKISADAGYGGLYDLFFYDDGTLYDAEGTTLALRAKVRDVKLNNANATYCCELA
jgi:hypothetical protein